MLTSIRHAADSVAFKLVLGIIVFGFVFSSVQSLLTTSSNVSLVVLKNADDVKLNDFLNEKHRLASLNVESSNKKIIDGLIIKSVMRAFIKSESLILGDEIVLDRIKEMPVFLDANNKFDKIKFKNHFDGNITAEEMFIENVRFNTSMQIVVENLFAEMFVPKIIEKRLIENNFAKKVTFDLLSVNLHNSDEEKKIQYTDTDLAEFYANNQDKFEVQEIREIKYLVMSKNFIKNSIKVSDSDIKKYLKEHPEISTNKTSVKDKSSNKAKTNNAIHNNAVDAIRNEMLESYIVNFIKQCEDKIASGDAIDQIAKDYNLQVLDAKVNANNVASNQHLKGLASNIFQSDSYDVSYPYEVDNKQTFVIYQISKIVPKFIPLLAEIKPAVALEYQKFKYYNDQMTKLDMIKNCVEIDKKDIGICLKEQNGIAYEKDLAMTYDDFIKSDKKNDIGFLSVFQTNHLSLSEPFVNQDMSNYNMIYVKKIDIDKLKLEELLRAKSKNMYNFITDNNIRDFENFLINKASPEINEELLSQINRSMS